MGAPSSSSSSGCGPAAAPTELEETTLDRSTSPPRPSTRWRQVGPGAACIARFDSRLFDSHVWLFDGAEGGNWLDALERELGVKVEEDEKREHKRVKME